MTKKLFWVFMAIFLPPITVLAHGRPMDFVINVVACCLLWVPGIIHAFYIMDKNRVW